MITLLAACALLAFSDAPDDITELPTFEIGVPPSCDDDVDCRVYPDATLCNTNTGECVECLGPEHCEEGWTCGPTGICLDACTVDADCDGVDGQSLCTPEGTCVECLTSGDCLEEQYCDQSSVCREDHCTPGEEFCFGNTIMLCLEDGGSTMEVMQCEGTCEQLGGPPECAEASGSTGGPVSPGDSSGSATGGTGGSATGPGGSTAPGTSGETSPADDEGDGGVKGCACRGTPHGGGAWAWLLVLGAALRRRR